LGKIFRFHAEGVIKPCTIVFPGDRRGNLHQLFIAEAFAQLLEQRIPDFNRSLCHSVGVLQNRFFLGGEERAAAEIPQGSNLFFRNSSLSADRRPDVNSKGTAYQRSDP